MSNQHRMDVACFFKQTGVVLARKLNLASKAGSVAAQWPDPWSQDYPR